MPGPKGTTPNPEGNQHQTKQGPDTNGTQGQSRQNKNAREKERERGHSPDTRVKIGDHSHFKNRKEGRRELTPATLWSKEGITHSQEREER